MRAAARLLQAVKRAQSCRDLISSSSVLRCSPGAREVGTEVGQEQSGFHGIYTPITLQLWGQRLSRERQASDDAKEAAPQPKAPKTLTIRYPFTSDDALKEKYRNPWNQVRIGKLLEDLDSMAGNIAYLHCDRGPETCLPVLVTASVDAIELLERLTLDRDLQVSGQVVWTGCSSLDIKMQMSQGPDLPASLVALFTFVAKDAATMKSAAVNPLRPTSSEEKEAFQQRQQLADARKAARQRSSDSAPDDKASEQQARIQELLKEARAAADLPALISGDAVLMRNTQLSNTFTCQPQQRNMHGRIFGGFLMRRAYELAFATAYMFAGAKPRFVMVDDVAFQRPVDVGNLLRLHSTVLHTTTQQGDSSMGRIYIQVIASVTKPEQISSERSNAFLFLFDVPMSSGAETGCRVLKRVLPSTDEEARLVCQIHAD